MSAIVTLFITGDNVSQSERRFNRDLTIGRLKEKLEPITGASCNYMKLKLYNRQDQLLGDLDDDSKMLGYYSVDDYWRIHVIDLNPYAVKGAYTDVSQVDKFELDESEYDKRTDTLRDYLRRNKLGKYSDAAQAALAEKELADSKMEVNEQCDIKTGERCEVDLDGMKRRGTVRYVGPVEGLKASTWIGIEYDEPLGKNDGSYNSKRYFECKPKHGGFVKPEKVTTGDFPEEDLFASDEEM